MDVRTSAGRLPVAFGWMASPPAFRLLGFPVQVKPGFMLLLVLVVFINGAERGVWLAQQQYGGADGGTEQHGWSPFSCCGNCQYSAPGH